MNSSAGSSSSNNHGGMEASSSGGSAASTPDVPVPSQQCSEPLPARSGPADGLGLSAAPPPASSASLPSVPLGDLLELQWTEHGNIFSQNIAKLRNKHMYTDATLACDGQFYPVHKFVLATCSEFFSAMFEWTPCVNPVLVLNNILTRDLEAILDFMYTGEASVKECNLSHVMKAAQSLRVRGLSMLEESRPVMHKPPVTPASAANASSTGSHFSRFSHTRQHPSVADEKQNVALSGNFEEPSSKRLKSEPIEDSKPPALSSDARSRLLKPVNKSPISLPSISSLTSPLHDTSLPKSQQMSLMHLYETSGGRATQAAHSSSGASQPHHMPRSQTLLPRQSSSPHPHLAGAASPHVSHAPPTTSRHLQQLLSSKSSPLQQQVYRHPSAVAHPQQLQQQQQQQQQQLLQQRRKETLLQHQQQLEAERRHLQQQLLQQTKQPGLSHGSHPQQHQVSSQQQHGTQHHQASPQHQHGTQHHQASPQHQHGTQHHQASPQQHHQVSSPHHPHQSSPQHLPSSQQHPHHQLQLSQHQQHLVQQQQQQQQQHHQHPRLAQSHYSQPYKQQQQQQHPQAVHGEVVEHQNQQLHAPQVHHHQSQPAISQQQAENELANKGNENSRVSELLLDHQSDLGGVGMKSSNGSTPTGNNNNLATGNHNFVSDQPSSDYNCRDESLQAALPPPPPPPPTTATLSTSGSKGGSSAVSVLDAAPLTPMEQQIISELGAAADGGIESSSAADADKAADGDSPEDMLDVLVNEDSLYGFNDEAGPAEGAACASAATLSPDGSAAASAGASDAAKQKDRRSTRPRTQSRTVVPAKKRKRKSSSGVAIDAATASSSENAVQVHPAELTSEGGMELAGGDEEDADAGYSLSGDAGGYDDGAGSSNTRMIPRLKCPHCPKICLKSETLTKHMLTHQDKEYSCSTCGFASTDFLELREHRRTHMSKHCTRCKFSTNRADALKKHVSMHVGGSRPGDGINSCSMCDFTPKNPTALKHHMKNHHDVDLSREAS